MVNGVPQPSLLLLRQRVAFGQAKAEVWIGISLTRLVFEPGSAHPTFFSTDELFSQGNYPAVLRHEPLIGGIDRLIEFLNGVLSSVRLQRCNDYEVERTSSHIHYRFGNHSQSLRSVIQREGLSKNLLRAVTSNTATIPATMRIGVLSASVRSANAAMQIGQAVNQVLQDWHCTSTLEDLGNGSKIESFLADSSHGQPIVLVPLEGKKGDRPPPAAIEWLQYLSAEKVAFQICSTAANPRYSRHGLAIAMLAKAGGSLFVVEPDQFSTFHQRVVF